MKIDHTQPSPDFYTDSGALDPTLPCYVTRSADHELLETLRRGQFCYILTPRQMGKSSLMARTAKGLQELNISTVIIDLSARDTKNASIDSWYQGQISDIADQLDITGNHENWWKRHRHLGPVQRFTNFLTQVVLHKTTKPIVIFIDEIDSTISLPFNCDDYFAAIRALYNKRSYDSTLKRLTFVLLGVASPSDLIKDPHRTPFNIGTRIQLTDFTYEEAQPLVSGLAPDPKLASQLLEQILLVTGGHPVLTQKTCKRVARWAKYQWNVSEASIIVESIVDEMFLSEAGRNTDDNLKFVLQRILEDKSATTLLRFYQRILNREILRDNEIDPIIVALKLSGLIKANESGTLIVRNSIYKRVFDKAWIKRALSQLDSQSQIVPNPVQERSSRFLYDVYISYSSRDSTWVKGYLVPHLKAAGLRLWIDSEALMPGTEWQSAIERGLEQTRNLIVVLSPASSASKFVSVESDLFAQLSLEDHERRLIPLILRPTDVPIFLQAFQWADFTQEENWDATMDQLLFALDAPIREKPSKLPLTPTTKSPVRYDTAAIRALLSSAFEDEDLKAFIYDYNRPLYKGLSPTMSKNDMIQALIEYTDEHMLFDKLLDNIARQRPRHYDKYRDKLEIRE